MKKIAIYSFLLIAFFFYNINTIMAQQADKTLSPYFKIVTTNSDASLPLKSTSADVNIAGVIADVVINQVYQNTGNAPIEAVYVFPTSTRAAVYDMEMKVNDRITKAIIQEKKEAKKTYEKAKAEGKRTSLLEQERPNVFTMHVANILPGDQVTVSLRYTESMIPEAGTYQFIYPTVVGPRYTGEQDHKKSEQINIPYTQEKQAPLYDFDLKVQLMAGMPLQDVSCSTHKTNIVYQTTERASIGLDTTEKNGGNRDFILSYKLAGNQITSGLLLYEGAEENHFMLTVQPPKQVKNTDIPDREYLFVVDVSGSMHGFPLEVTKKLMRNLMANLRPSDKFNLLLFAGNANVYSPESVYATAEEVESAINILTSTSGGGGTRLMNALKRVVAIPKCDDGLSRSVVVVTDGYISVERKVYDFIRQYNKDYNFYSFGIGSSTNRYLIDGIAHVGNSEPLFVTDQTKADEQAEKFRQRIAAPVLTNIHIDWGDFQVYDFDTSSLSDVLAERPVVITGKYRGKATGKIKLTGVSGSGDYQAIYEAKNAIPSKDNQAVKYLWARNKIRLLDDYIQLDQNEDNKAEVTRLGLKYNLMTNYTSFVAVDQQPVLAANTVTESVTQPLPLPQGVSNMAIGTSSPQYASAVGAALVISNENGQQSSINYEVSANALSSIENRFLEIALNQRLATLIKKFGKDQLQGLIVQLKLDKDGQVVQVIMNDIDLDRQTYRSIVKEIKAWQLIIKRKGGVQFKLTIG